MQKKGKNQATLFSFFLFTKRIYPNGQSCVDSEKILREKKNRERQFFTNML